MTEEKPTPPAPPPAAPPAPKPPAAAAPTPPPPETAPEDLRSIRDALAIRFPEAILEEKVFRGEMSLRIRTDLIVDVCRYLRDERRFNFLSDLCGAHYPTREKPLEVVYHLYSIPNRNFVRLKISLAEGEAAPTVTGVWGTANWHEREAYDMFGITFAGHPDLKRILLPDDWQGFPLRKEYPMAGRGDYPIPSRDE